MVKKRKPRGKQSLLSKAKNLGLIALGASRLLGILFTGASMAEKAEQILREATFGLGDPSGPKFDLNAGLLMYAPVGGALALGTFLNFLLRKFPVRR